MDVHTANRGPHWTRSESRGQLLVRFALAQVSRHDSAACKPPNPEGACSQLRQFGSAPAFSGINGPWLWASHGWLSLLGWLNGSTIDLAEAGCGVGGGGHSGSRMVEVRGEIGDSGATCYTGTSANP